MAATPSLNLIAIERGEHLFVFRYDDHCVGALRAITTAVKWAADPELQFGMPDVRQLIQSSMRLKQEADARARRDAGT